MDEMFELLRETIKTYKPLREGIEITIGEGLTNLAEIVNVVYQNKNNILQKDRGYRKEYLRDVLFTYLGDCYLKKYKGGK